MTSIVKYPAFMLSLAALIENYPPPVAKVVNVMNPGSELPSDSFAMYAH